MEGGVAAKNGKFIQDIVIQFNFEAQYLVQTSLIGRLRSGFEIGSFKVQVSLKCDVELLSWK